MVTTIETIDVDLAVGAATWRELKQPHMTTDCRFSGNACVGLTERSKGEDGWVFRCVSLQADGVCLFVIESVSFGGPLAVTVKSFWVPRLLALEAGVSKRSRAPWDFPESA